MRVVKNTLIVVATLIALPFAVLAVAVLAGMFGIIPAAMIVLALGVLAWAWR